MTTSN